MASWLKCLRVHQEVNFIDQKHPKLRREPLDEGLKCLIKHQEADDNLKYLNPTKIPIKTNFLIQLKTSFIFYYY
jgi:hypothetical protein